MYAEATRATFPSDTNLLVDACIARVREVARLDDKVVLPPLPVVPRQDVVIMTKEDTPLATDATVRVSRSLAPTAIVSRPSATATARPSRWPTALCGFIAGAAACAAFLASPVGHRPSVQRVTHSAHAHATNAVHATAAFFNR
jgi:hypothetical protein